MSEDIQQGILVVISAPSGCGKTTIVSRLLKKHPDWVRSVSVTTRKPREGEKMGQDYFFVSGEAFEEMRQKKELLESAQVFEYAYGTPKTFVRDHYEQHKCVILAVDVQGAEQIRAAMLKEKMPLATVFILPPSLKVLRERLEGRQTDSKEQIETRLNAAQSEIKEAGAFDFAVINQNLDETVLEIEKFIEKFRKERGNQ